MHDMDEVTCPKCGGRTILGMITGYGKCARCIKIDRKVSMEVRNDY